MDLENTFEQFGWSTNRNRTGNDGPGKHDQSPPLRYPDLSDNPNRILILVIVLPFLFTALLCTLTYCCYRWKKQSKERNQFDRSTVERNLPSSTIINNEHYNPYTIEDLPPAYEFLSETKKISFDEQTKTSDVHLGPFSH